LRGWTGLERSSRGDLEGAERLLRRALSLDEQLGRLAGMAKRYELLAAVYEARGECAPARALAARARELERSDQMGPPARSGVRLERDKEYLRRH
jgi:hypothetical protein